MATASAGTLVVPSCVITDVPEAEPFPGWQVIATCMCAQCLDQPFCYNPQTAETIVLTNDSETCLLEGFVHSLPATRVADFQSKSTNLSLCA